MFRLEVRDAGKRFYQRWLFRNISLQLAAGERLAITGTNGSGKSTLLRMLAGQLSPSEGDVFFAVDGQRVGSEAMYRHLSWAGPQIEPYAELSLAEHLKLHFRLRKPHTNLGAKPVDAVIELLALGEHAHKPLQVYSSGMLQRVKVGTALFTESDLLLLDEPTSNMDTLNADRMLGLIAEWTGERAYVLASNLDREYGAFSQVLRLGSV